MSPGDAPMDVYRPLVASTFADGSLGVQPHWIRMVLALLIDFLVVAGLVVALCLAAAPWHSHSPVRTGVLVGSCALLLPWFLGFLCFTGHTPGTLVAGTRLVRLADGTAPGVWRGGWLMFQRTILNLFHPAPIALALRGDGAASGFPPMDREFHVGIDRRRTAGLRGGARQQ